MTERLELGRVLEALANPSRRRIVTELAADQSDSEHACGSFERALSKATKTHHFKVLRAAGLVVQRNHGNGSTLTLRRQAIDDELPGLLDLLSADRSNASAGAAGAGPTDGQ